MSIIEVVYQIVIAPLAIVMETIYGAAYNILGNAGGAILPLSFAASLLILPLYKRADAIQVEERALEKRMESDIKHIRKTFHGDERYMMQQAYYRVNAYKPIYQLRSALPLLLQIPFFIAAYQLLSHLTLLEGVNFLGISDLSKPDALLSVGGISVNLLPLVMTSINLASSYLYSRDMRLRDKLQLYMTAVVFLVLLYQSPSGLVLYWTFNNVFSLMRNVITRTKKPMVVRDIILSLLGIFVLAYGILQIKPFSFEQTVVILVSILFHVPWALRMIRSCFPSNKGKKSEDSISLRNGGNNPLLFFAGCLFMATLSGILIPASVISNSPAEFVMVSEYKSPVLYVFQAFLLGFGLFIVWIGLFYYFCDSKKRKILEIAIWVICICGTFNYMLFGTNLGLLTPILRYDATPAFTTNEILINSEALLVVATLVIIVFMKKKKILSSAAPVLIIAVLALSGKYLVNIQNQMPSIKNAIVAGESTKKAIKLSRNGKNVVVIMMDCAISSFLPYCFEEKPELVEKYDGFTWYPNTISYGPQTNTGSPGIFGGYEYIPEEMNRRSEQSLASKQNEALRLMPVVFSNAGYQVTVCDPTYANYTWIPDVSIFDDYPEITAFNTENGQMNSEFTMKSESKLSIWKRNFFCFSMMKMSPLALQGLIYQNGTYFSPDRHDEYLYSIQTLEGMTKAQGLNEEFIEAYSALSALPDLTQVLNTKCNSFFMISNSTTHELAMLREPEYVPAQSIDNSEYEEKNQDRFTVNGRTMTVNDEEQIMAYQINMAALIKMGDWFDYLRSKNIYDNTRIIVVADHGRTLRCFSDMLFGDEIHEDAMRYNPLLLVKDFNEHGFRQVNQFMTNADTPLLAFEGLIENPINPATGIAITNETKYDEEQHVFYSDIWQTSINNGNMFLPGIWISLRNQNIFDANNWKVIGKK